MSYPGETNADRRRLSKQMDEVLRATRFQNWVVWRVVQVCLGLWLGSILDYLLSVFVENLLIDSGVLSFHVFDGMIMDAIVYNNPGLLRAIECCIFASVLLCFLALKRFPFFSYLAIAGLVSHILVGGLLTLFVCVFIS